MKPRRTLLLVVLFVAGALAPQHTASPQDSADRTKTKDSTDDFRWDPKKRWKAVAGARLKWDVEINTKSTEKATVPNHPAYTEEHKDTVSFQAVVEVVVVADDGSISDEKIKFEHWKRTTLEAKTPDTTLTKKTVHLMGSARGRSFTVEGEGDPASEASREWIEQFFIVGELETELENDRRWLAPMAPVGSGAKWTRDVATVAPALYPEVEVDLAKSSVSGKLGALSVKDDVHHGHWDAKAVFHFKKSPTGVEWSEALEEISVSVDGSLELDKSPAEEWRTETKFNGRGEVKGAEPGKLEQHLSTIVTSKWGPVEKGPAKNP